MMINGDKSKAKGKNWWKQENIYVSSVQNAKTVIPGVDFKKIY